MGVLAGSKGVQFIKRHDGQLYKLAVPYVFTPTRFGGQRAWFQCPGCRQGCRVLYGTNSLRCRRCRGRNFGCVGSFDSPTTRDLSSGTPQRS
jgi:hypothetical protein